MAQLIVLDRDGFINYDSCEFVKSSDEWRPIEWSVEAIAQLSSAAYTVAVAGSLLGQQVAAFDDLASVADLLLGAID